MILRIAEWLHSNLGDAWDDTMFGLRRWIWYRSLRVIEESYQYVPDEAAQ